MSTASDIQTGLAVAKRASDWRAKTRHKIKPGDPDRQEHVAQLLDQIDEAMKPIRSAIGSLLWHAEYRQYEDKLRAVSKVLQYQRKQLKKMRR